MVFGDLTEVTVTAGVSAAPGSVVSSFKDVGFVFYVRLGADLSLHMSHLPSSLVIGVSYDGLEALVRNRFSFMTVSYKKL